MKLFLKILFGTIFGWMTGATIRTYDAYRGFITFYVWVVYKERGWTERILWRTA